MTDASIHDEDGIVRRVGEGREVRVFGPPGCGKTTWLSKKIAATARSRGPDAIIAASFTRTAAEEIAGRDLPVPKRQIGTLHSLAYRSIDTPEVTERHLHEWNERHPDLALTLNAQPTDLDDGAPAEVVTGATRGDELLGDVERHRALMRPREMWRPEEKIFYDKWCEWKDENELIDFTDMIEIALDSVPAAPGNPEVAFFDEVQDFTPLELALVRKWGEVTERIVLAGDDDQCHAAGTSVLTTNRGWASIETLDPEVDRLVSYDRFNGGEVRGRLSRWGAPSEGYQFEIASRPFRGSMVRVTTDTTSVEATPDHRLLVRWAEAAREKHAVYLMRRGDDWRIGLTQVLYDNGTFGPSMRCRQQRGDCVWILGTYDRRVDAMFAEETFARESGLTKMLFDTQGAMNVTQAELDTFHERLRPDSGKRARALLEDLGLLEAHPFWGRRDAQKVGASRAFVVRSANFVSGLMEVPTYAEDADSSVPVWRVGVSERRNADCEVFSLNVEPYHHYIADGQVVPNCLYRFKGATPDAFLDPPLPDVDRLVLSQSYRVPAKIHRMAEAWIAKLSRRESKEYLPRDEDGSVQRSTMRFDDAEVMAEALAEAAEAGTVMYLATCAYMLDPVKHEMKKRGIPFHNPYRRKRGDWNPLLRRKNTTSSAERLVSYLIMDEDAFGEAWRLWTGRDLKRWSACVKSQGVFVRGAKGIIEAIPDGHEVAYQELEAIFSAPEIRDEALEPSIEWFRRNLLSAKAPAMAYPIAIAKRYGPQTLLDEPRITIGTIHSVKGGQADTVFLAPDLSIRGEEQWYGEHEQRDSVIRQMYVGMTRPRSKLIMLSAATSRCVDPEYMLEGLKGTA